MGQIKSWEVSDEFWAKVEPLIPRRERDKSRTYRRRVGGGRKPTEPRQVFAGIVYVLRTGIQWKALPRSFGSASAMHQHFQDWQKAGFFLKLWQAGLAGYDTLEGIAWNWQSIDGAMHKAPLAQECSGANPTDRGKKRAQAQPAGGQPWRPALRYLTLCIDEAHFLWPQRNLREASPRRIGWVRTSLANYGVPVALVATHQFTRAQHVIEKNTHWSSEQLIGRIAFCAKLPDHLAKDDLAAVVRFHLPEAEQRTVDFLVDYVIASKKHLACVDHGVRAARKEGRTRVTHRDVMLGFQNTVLPSDRNLASAAETASPASASAKRRPSNVYATPLQTPRKTLSAPLPERETGTALSVKDRPNNRSASASLSTG